MTTLTVLGAGWLGKPLALHLQALGHTVFASKTTEQGVEELTRHGLNGFKLNLQPNNCSLADTLNEQACEVLIVAFPPRLRSDSKGKDYADKWLCLVNQLKLTKVKKVIMVSSTSVYPNVAQECIEEDATYQLSQQSERFSDGAQQILKAEQHLIDSGINYCIVRCSGLMGPNRHPARFVRHLKVVSQSAPANMIHLDDVVGAIEFLIETNGNMVVNATTPNTVSKAVFYKHAIDSTSAIHQLPTLIEAPDKKILASKLVGLGYQFKYQHIIEALDSIPYSE